MVVYNVNGYVNLLKTDNKNLDISIMFFKTLSQSSDLDIRVLRCYSKLISGEETITKICRELQITGEQIRFVKEKLERFGLLQSKNDEISDNNLNEIVIYIQNIIKQNKKSNSIGVKVPKLKKLYRNDSF